MRSRISTVRISSLLALATALAGIMNLFSALFPAFHWRYLLLRDAVSVGVINDSQIATALLGILLVLLPLRLITDQQYYLYHGYQAHWFGMSLWMIGAVALGASALLILRPLIPIHKSNVPDRDRARRILQQFGTDTLSYFALRDDRGYFF